MENSRVSSTQNTQTVVTPSAVNPTSTSVPVSSYTPNPSTVYPLESLELETSTEKSTPGQQNPPATIYHPKFRKRKAILASAAITAVIFLITGTLLAVVTRRASDSRSSVSNIPTQDIELRDQAVLETSPELISKAQALIVSGDVVTRGELKLSNNSLIASLKTDKLTDNRSYVLPNSSGTVCLSSNNCNFVTSSVLQAEVSNIDTTSTVITNITNVSGGAVIATTVNGISSSVTIQGTTNQVNVNASGNSITLSTPQDIATSSSPTFGGLTISSGGLTTGFSQVAAGAIMGVDEGLYIDSSGKFITFNSGNRKFILPNSGPGEQTICTSGISCAEGGGQAVLLASGATPQTDNTTYPSIFINKTNAGNILQLQTSGSNTFVVASTGAVTGGLYNGQTISSSANLTGTLTVAGAVTGGLYNGQTISSSANLTGTLAVATSLTSPSLDRASAGNLDIGTLTQTNLTLGRAGVKTTINGQSTSVISFGTPYTNWGYYLDANLGSSCLGALCHFFRTDFNLAGSTVNLGAGFVVGEPNHVTINNGAGTSTTTINSAVALNGLTTLGGVTPTLQSATSLSLISGAALNVGTSTATSVSIGRTGITTTNNGALTVSQLLTGSAGLTVSGGAINLNVNTNSATNINSGTSTGAITIGNASAGAMILRSNSTIGITGAGNLTLKGDRVILQPTTTDNVNSIQFNNVAGSEIFSIDTTSGLVGTYTSDSSNSTRLTIQTGNVSGGSSLSSGHVILQSGSANGPSSSSGNVTIRSGPATHATGVSSGDITIDVGSTASTLTRGKIYIGNNSGSTGASRFIYIGGVDPNDPLDTICRLPASCATTSQTNSVYMGSVVGNSTTVILGGDPTDNSTGLVLGYYLGRTDADSTPTLDIMSNDADRSLQVINIGGGRTLKGTGLGTYGKTVNIANGIPDAGTSNTVSIATGGTNTGTVGVTIGSSGAEAHTTTIRGGNGSGAVALQTASGGTISVGSSAASTINIGTGNFAHTIAIGDNSGSAQGITIGSTHASSTIAIRGGGGINIGTAGSANTIQIGNTTGAVTQAINIGNNATASSTNNVTIGSTIGSSTTNIRGGSGLVNITSGTLQLGTSSSINGSLVLLNSTNALGVTLSAASQTVGSATISLPNTSGSNDTLCLATLANCAGLATTTLQQAYGNDADGSDAIISLTSADGSVVISNPSSGGSTSAFVLKVQQASTASSASGLLVSNAGGSSGYSLRVNDDGTDTDSTPLVVDSAGNVGIGTDTLGLAKTAIAISDASTSQYQNTSGVLGVVNTNQTDNNWAYIYFGDETADNAASAIGAKLIDHTNNYSDLVFSTRSGGGMAARMTILSGGNVGIGDTTPASLFTVGNGDLFQVNSSGAIAAVAGITSTGNINLGDGVGAVLGTDTDATIAYNGTENRIAVTGNNANLFIEDRFSLGVDSRTIADNGGGTPATLTLNPNSSVVTILCQDANGCDVTMSESTGVVEGNLALILISGGSNTVNFADTSGVSELSGAFAANDYDSLSLLYANNRWIELSRSDN